MFRATAAALIAVLLAPATADAKCARMHQQPEVLTKDVEIPADGGGVVVGTTQVPYSSDDIGEARQPSWGWITGRDLGEPTITELAPGLVVYGVPSGLRITGDLVDGKGGVVAKAKVTRDKVALLAAPKVKAIVHQTYQGPRGRHGTTTVRLDGDAPADAVALIVLDAKTKRARSYGEPAGTSDIVVFASRRCGVLPSGTVESKAGEQVIVRWVDKYGRLSAATKPIRILAGPT